MNDLHRQYLDWRLLHNNYVGLDPYKTDYYVSLDELISGHENSTKFNIKLDILKFKKKVPGFFNILKGDKLLYTYYLIFNQLDTIVTTHLLSVIFKQLHHVYNTIVKYKLTKFCIYDIVIDKTTNNPTCIYVVKSDNDGNYEFCAISFVYILFLTEAYQDLLEISDK